MRPTKVLAIVAFAMATAACSGLSSGDVQEAREIGDLSDVTIPPAYTTFTDDQFSISYPPNWQTDPSIISQLQGDVQELFGDELDLSEGRLLFFAGVPNTLGGFLPNVNIAIEPLPGGMSVEDYADASVRTIGRLVDDHAVLATFRVNIGDREGILMSHQLPASYLDPALSGLQQFASLNTVQGDVGWTVTCTATVGDAGNEADLAVCDLVLRSFRILGP